MVYNIIYYFILYVYIMKIDKDLLVDDFTEKTFSEKKESLLNILRRLPWDTGIVVNLREMVYFLEESNEKWVYIEVYDILLDTIISVDDNNSTQAIDNLWKIHELLINAKKEEEKEINNESKELEAMFNDL